MSPPTTVHVCRKCKTHRMLSAELQDTAGVDVDLVKCQSICKAAVAGLEVDGTMVWFRRLRGTKDRKALAKLARRGGAGPVPKRLRDHVASRRTGRPPRRASG